VNTLSLVWFPDPPQKGEEGLVFLGTQVSKLKMAATSNGTAENYISCDVIGELVT